MNRSIVRTAAIVVCLGGLSQAAPVGAISDLSCSAREDNARVAPRKCSAGSSRDVPGNAGICIGQTARLRSGGAPFTVVTMMKPTHQNLCLKANSSAPLSHLALQAEP